MDEITALDLLLDPNNRNDVAITAIINNGQASELGKLTTDEVFESLYKSGDYETLLAAKLAGNVAAIMAFEALKDAKMFGQNTVNFALQTTTNLLDGLQTAGLSVTGRNALTTQATKKQVVKRVDEISRALCIAEGSMVL